VAGHTRRDRRPCGGPPPRHGAGATRPRRLITVQGAVADERSRIAAGIAFMLAGTAAFVVMDAVVKWLVVAYPVIQIVFFRNLFALMPIAVLIGFTGGRASIRTRRLGSHVLRAGAGLGAMFCFFHAYGAMALADVIAISFAAPVFVTALSVPLLGEKVGPRRWTAVLVGFLGVLVMVRPGVGVLDPAALVALLGTALMALAMIMIRNLGRTETAPATVLYFTMFGIMVSGVGLPFVWVAPDAEGWALLVLTGLIGGVGQFCMTQAFRLAPVAVVAPFDYSAMLWATGIGYLVWSDWPDMWIWVGAAILVASGLYILFRETHLSATTRMPVSRRGR